MKHLPPEPRLDPVKLEVYWRRLITAMDETDKTVHRTAFSTIIGESGDFACVLLTPDGMAVAQSTFSTTSFTITIPMTVRRMLAFYSLADLDDGDVLVLNDPWHGAGHLPDVTLAKPVFHGGRVVAFIATCAHLPDIGGHKGYFNASEVFEEGLRIPPSKLYVQGRENRDVFDIIAKNVRVPELVIGDLRGIASAQHVGAKRVAEFLGDYGLDGIEGIAAEIFHRSETAMRAAIEAIPDGEYHHACDADSFSGPLHIEMTIRVEGEHMSLDLTGSSPQFSFGATNNTLASTKGAIMVCLKSALTPLIPNNEGQFASIEVSAPLGSAFNAAFPAAVQARSVAKVHLTETIHLALAEVLPDRVCAGTSTFWSIHVHGRVGGKVQKAHLIPDGGLGGRATKDGLSTIRYPGNGSVAPVEVFESRAPVLIEKKEYWTDSAGPGRFRGGLGQVLSIRALADASVTIRPNNVQYPAPGILGGQAAVAGDYRINGVRPPLKPMEIQAGDLVEAYLPGGAGFGPVADRDPNDIERDVAYGFVSAEAARRDYGLASGGAEDGAAAS